MSHLSQKSNWFSHIHNVLETKKEETRLTEQLHDTLSFTSAHLLGVLSTAVQRAWVPGWSSPASVLSSDRTEGKHASQRKSWSRPSAADGRQHSNSGDPKREQTLQKEHKTQSLRPMFKSPALINSVRDPTATSLFSKVASLAPSI